jgi:hypothetical protein
MRRAHLQRADGGIIVRFANQAVEFIDESTVSVRIVPVQNPNFIFLRALVSLSLLFSNIEIKG